MYNSLPNGYSGPGVNLMNGRGEPYATGHRRPRNNELSRLLSAALVSPQYKQMVLQEPERALAEGYMGQHFDLDAVDSAIVCSRQANTLQELAIALVNHSRAQQQEQPRWEKLVEASSLHGDFVGELSLRSEYSDLRPGICE